MENGLRKQKTPEDIFLDVKNQADEYLELTEDGRALSEKCRDYVDGKQWTAAEIEELKRRKQAPIVVNRIKPKLQGLLGLVSARRTDPKAFPRTQKEDKSAEAVTDALRFVADANNLNCVRQEVADCFFTEGVGGAFVNVRRNHKGEVNIVVDEIPWDRIYYDPFSRKRDFSDARYIGMMQWLDEEELLRMFPDAKLDDTSQYSTYETFEDRPRWVDKRENRRRYRVAWHFYKTGDSWNMCVFTEGSFLMEPQESPYLDDEGVPTCPIELVGAYIDRDNQRYGELAAFLDLQDEINHRRSKALFLLSQRQTAGREGAIDVAVMKRELSKPDGHVSYKGEKGDFEVLSTGDMAAGQVSLLQEAKSEIDAQSFNAQLAGDRQKGDLSGKAIARLQQAGVTELNNLFTALNGWEKRIYRQIWARIKQFWTEEKWIRVTDDQDSLRWVGLNAQIPASQWLEETANDKSVPMINRKRAAAALQFLTQAANSNNPQEAQAAQAELDKPVDVRNMVPELDVDIILEQSFDTVNVQEEQFQLLAQLSQNPQFGLDPVELIRVSQLRGKDELIDRIEQSRKTQQEQNGNIKQIQAQGLQAKNMETMSKAQLNQVMGQQKQLENSILSQYPVDMRPQVVV